MKLLINSIVEAIEDDILNRGGLGNAWDFIDDCVKHEIRAEWMSIIAREFKKRGLVCVE